MGAWLVPIVLIAVVLYLARTVLTPFVVAGVLAYIFSPVVDQIQARGRISHRVAVVGVLYIILIGALALGIWLVEARLVREFRALSELGPDIVDTAFVRLLGSDKFTVMGQDVDPHLLAVWTNERAAAILDAPHDALQIAERAVDVVGKTLLTLVVLFYLLLDGGRIGSYLIRFVPSIHRDRVTTIAGHVHLVLGQFLRGQLYLIALMSFVTYLVLQFIFHLPFALPIAIMTGVLEIIPLFGPIMAGAIACTVGLVSGGVGHAISIGVAYLILRQAEDQLVMPIVVGRAVHLHPLITIFAVLTGAASAGVLGAIMGVPVAAALRVILDYLLPNSVEHTPTDEPVLLPVQEAAPGVTAAAPSTGGDQAAQATSH